MPEKTTASLPEERAGREIFLSALMRGDANAVTALLGCCQKDWLLQEKERILDRMTNDYLEGRIPFCQLTAAAEALRPLRPSKNRPVALCGCVSGNTSRTGQAFLLMMLEAWGVPCRDMGTDVPVTRFLDGIRRIRPQFVIASIFSKGNLTSLLELDRESRAHGLRDRFLLITGGGGLSPADLNGLPVDCPYGNAAEVARWVKQKWRT